MNILTHLKSKYTSCYHIACFECKSDKDKINYECKLLSTNLVRSYKLLKEK